MAVITGNLIKFFTRALVRGLLAAAMLMHAVAQTATAQEETGSQLFQSLEPLRLTINAPFNSIHRDRGDDREYQPATMLITDNNGQQAALDLEIRVRGKFRARKDICQNPPLRLNFKRNSLDNTVFEGEDKLKLVVQCKNSDAYEQYLYLEYLNYRVYQLFTDNSLRVRMATVTYYDTERERDLGTRPAFFIEDEDLMGERTGMTQVKADRLRPADYDAENLNLVALFQYFTGNTDWSAFSGPAGDECCHNIIPYSRGSGPMVPVPYDFDSTGMVDASYAQVADALPIRNVRQRLYRGVCQADNILQANVARFREKENEIRALFANQAGLSDRTLSSALNYVDLFYETINDPADLKKSIIDKCRG